MKFPDLSAIRLTIRSLSTAFGCFYTLKSSRLRNVLVLILLMSGFCADAQVRRLGVLGSSTANGHGIPADSSWVQRAKRYYRHLALIDTLHKVTASSYDCYHGMPTGYVPPTGRNAPNTSYNITRLMTRSLPPTTVIINYPSNGYNIFSDKEILFCLDSIKKYANAKGAVCFVATTQPRDNFNDAARARLKYLNDLIKNYFGEYAIDFFTPLNNPANNKLKPEYSLGDGIHPNSRGHEVLFQQVLKKNIFNINLESLQRILIDVGSASGSTSSPDQSGLYWNNMTDARKGLRVNNAVTTTNVETSLKLEVINPIGSLASTDPGTSSSGAVGKVAEYPATATNDNAFAATTITNGKWRIYGLDPAKNYSLRFWGSQTSSGYRIIQIKRSDETAWQEYNAGSNRNYTAAATFLITGKTEISFDMRVKSGSVAGHINVVDIVITAPPGPPANQPPTARAGSDVTIMLPLDSLQLNGSSSSDPEGLPLEYEWQQISGPSSFAISNNKVPNPVLSNLEAGVYLVELKVTDDQVLIDTDTLQVLVKINQPPSANAGPDKTVTLPQNSVQLQGSGSDPDNNISLYAWHQVSGPSSGVFNDSGIANAIVSDLLQGTYTFELTVTDSYGLTDKDTVSIEVNPQPLFTSQRILIDAGLASVLTRTPDQNGKYWNNMSDARKGLRVNNARTTDNILTTIKLEVINPLGSSGPTDLNVRTSNTVGDVGDYPASATNDNAFVNKSITNGMWKFYELDAASTYTIKFWGSYSLAETRIVQIKRTDETTWQEYNAAFNTDYHKAAVFTFTGKNEISFNIRTKAGNTFGHINVVDITVTTPVQQAVIQRSMALPENNLRDVNSVERLYTTAMKVYPNPVRSASTLTLQNDYRGIAQISVTNRLGVTVKQFSVYKWTSSFNCTLELNKLLPGTYFIVVRMRDKTERVAMIKL